MNYINSGKKEGAKLLAGGDVGPFKRGYFVQPTVFGDVTDDMKIAREEIFGPVMSILKFKDLEEVIQRANNTQYGLAASVFSGNFAKAKYVSSKLRVGTVWVNCYDVFDAGIPFGGFKKSGVGRELGLEAMNNYLETKAVVLNQQF